MALSCWAATVTLRVVVTGASGLIGSALLPALREAGHDVRTLVRRAPRTPNEISWSPDDGEIDVHAFEGTAAVIHLAGAGVGDRRWTPTYKEVVRRSRVRSTDLIARAVADARVPVLLSSSAAGYYGTRGNEVLTESSPPGDGFRAEVCRAWETAADPARGAGARVVLLRSGIVLSRAGGLLPVLARPFRLFVGGPIGSRPRWFPWISIDDEVGAILHLLVSNVEGPVNLVAPEQATSDDLAQAIARALHRPAAVRVGDRLLELMAGTERAREVLLASQRVECSVLLASGYGFRHPTLRAAIEAVLLRR